MKPSLAQAFKAITIRLLFIALLLYSNLSNAGMLNAVADQARTAPNVPVLIPVLSNDQAADNNPMMILQVTQPAHGRVMINSASPAPTPALASLIQFAASRFSNDVAQIADTNLYPRATQSNGSWGTRSASDWTCGFFPGALWNLYAMTGDVDFRYWAESWTAGIASQQYVTNTDDLGFMINNSFGLAYSVTTNPAYLPVELQAAQSVVSVRYDPVVGCIGDDLSTNTLGVVIDSMMNLELLFRAACLGGDTNLYAKAVNHATKTMLDFIRPDGGNWHGVIYDKTTGLALDKSWRAAASADSTWARGHSWGTYGFAMAYRETGNLQFLDAAQRMADYYLANVPPDMVPYWDFQDPAIPNSPKDSSAAAITLSALVQLGQLATNFQDSARYWRGAQQILVSLSSTNYLAQGSLSSGVLLHGTGEFPPSSEVDVSLIYADYYFIEALKRCWQLSAQTTVTYVPAPGFQGTDVFTYSVCDGAGNYSTANVTVNVEYAAPSPAISFLATTHWPVISFLASSGKTYFVQYRNDLIASAAWHDLATNISGSDSIISVSDTNAPAQRFYRVGMN